MRNKITILIFIILAILTPCKSQEKETSVRIETEFGNITLKLYNETPKHRDNFIKLIKSGFYNDRIFHRVIKNFMIQGGDAELPEELAQTNKTDSFNYRIPAEINRKLIHKKGVLAAARTGDNENPLQESSSTQFYIVQGQKFSVDKLKQIEARINNSLIRKAYLAIYNQEVKNTQLSKEEIEKKAQEEAIEIVKKKPFSYTPQEIEIYTTIGGTPHLDMNYTVFGEVVSGMEVIEKIAEQQTNEKDRPINNIKFSIRIIE
jgi:peptidylprolyl isomerase